MHIAFIISKTNSGFGVGPLSVNQSSCVGHAAFRLMVSPQFGEVSLAAPGHSEQPATVAAPGHNAVQVSSAALEQ